MTAESERGVEASYLAGWRDAMKKATGGDWSEAYPAWWSVRPAVALSQTYPTREGENP